MPSFVFVFFNDTGIQRAKYEGTAEIQQGLSSGNMKGVIRELQKRRYVEGLHCYVCTYIVQYMYVYINSMYSLLWCWPVHCMFV